MFGKYTQEIAYANSVSILLRIDAALIRTQREIDTQLKRKADLMLERQKVVDVLSAPPIRVAA